MKSFTGVGLDIAPASISDTLAMLRVSAETGLSSAEVDARRGGCGFNEVLKQKDVPLLRFLKKFWGLSAWMLELIVILSAVLRKYSDLVIVCGHLIVNAVLSFAQERRAAGVVESLRRRCHRNIFTKSLPRLRADRLELSRCRGFYGES